MYVQRPGSVAHRIFVNGILSPSAEAARLQRHIGRYDAQGSDAEAASLRKRLADLRDTTALLQESIKLRGCVTACLLPWKVYVVCQKHNAAERA